MLSVPILLQTHTHTHTNTYVTAVTNGAIKVTLNGATHNRTLVNSLPDKLNFTNKYHSSHHLLILCFQFQQIQTRKQHHYTFDSRTVNTLFLLDIFSTIFTQMEFYFTWI